MLFQVGGRRAVCWGRAGQGSAEPQRSGPAPPVEDEALGTPNPPGGGRCALRSGQSAGAPRGARRVPSAAHAPAAGRQGGGWGVGRGEDRPGPAEKEGSLARRPHRRHPASPAGVARGGGGGQSTMAVSWRSWLANEGSKHLFLVGRCLGVGDGGAQPRAEGRRFPPAREVDPAPGGRAHGAACPGAGSGCSLLALVGKVWGRRGVRRSCSSCFCLGFCALILELRFVLRPHLLNFTSVFSVSVETSHLKAVLSHALLLKYFC